MRKFRQFIGVFVTIFVVLTLTTPLYAGLDDKSLVLYLSFDEGKGGDAGDGSVHGHDGELIKDPKWVNGQFGKALEFDGTKQQYVMVPITDTLQLREQFSIAFLVKRSADQIRDWNYMVAAGELVWASIFRKGDSKTYFWSKAPGWAQKGVSDDIQPEDWVHLAVTHDTKSEVVIYNDGKKAGGGAKPPAIIEVGGSIMVGARHPGQEFFTGIIDEVFLFDRIITEAEVGEIMSGDFLPVEPAEKLATTWASIKTGRD